MTKTTLLVRIAALLFCALLTIPAIAGVSQQEKKASSQAELIDQFGIPQPNELLRKPIEKVDPRGQGEAGHGGDDEANFDLGETTFGSSLPTIVALKFNRHVLLLWIMLQWPIIYRWP